MDTTSRHIYSVSELNRAAKQILDIELPSLWLEGEISNLSRPASGHWYFSLKDENAQIRCAMFKRANSRVKFNVTNGDKVLIRGKVSLYEARGDYQLIADQMEDSGTGALQRAYEELRDKLAKEGLFAAEYKQELPELPSTIGVITSSTGAALQDILHVLERRLPMVQIKIYPVLVQGDLAPAEIAHAIKQADIESLCDLLIVGRGGGSLEDLWAFNDERVARAAFTSNTPIISAVGHEIDFTILDFVADLRAPTPSAAAEVATPITQDDLAAQVRSLFQYISKASSEHLQKKAQKLDYLSKRLQLAHPGQKLKQQQDHLHSQSFRLHELMQRLLKEQKNVLGNLNIRIKRQDPVIRVANEKEKIIRLKNRLNSSSSHALQLKKASLGQVIGKLNTLSPLATLERGYALVQLQGDKVGKNVVTSVSDVNTGEIISTKLKDGDILSTVTKINKSKSKK